jgi:site-specific DNA-methyltransferase (adenine-specific)
MNRLFYGDNLNVLREHFKDDPADLIYLDPPFNSQASYNVLYPEPSGQQSEAQVKAFVDTWHWNDSAEQAFDDVMRSSTDAAEMLRAFRAVLGESDMMAYLAMMAVRLLELHRVLKPTGAPSIFTAIPRPATISKSCLTPYSAARTSRMKLHGGAPPQRPTTSKVQ